MAIYVCLTLHTCKLVGRLNSSSFDAVTHTSYQIRACNLRLISTNNMGVNESVTQTERKI